MCSDSSADRDLRLVSTEPFTDRGQQEQPQIIILDDDNRSATSENGASKTPSFGAYKPMENATIPEGILEARHISASAIRISNSDVIEATSQGNRTTPLTPRVKRISSLLTRMKDKRMNVIAKRLQMQEEREALRVTRNTAIEKTAQLMTALNAFFATNIPPGAQSLQVAFEKVQRAGDTYLPKEDDYNTLEGGLNHEEWELRELEAKFYRRLERSQSEILADATYDTDDANDLQSESSSSQSRHTPYPPILHELLSRLGDVDLIKEQLTDLRSERAQLVEQQRLLASAGRGLAMPYLDFLASFDSTHEELQRQIFELETDVDRLRDAWKQEGLTSQVDEDALEDEGINLDNLPPPYPEPLLLDQPSSIKNLPQPRMQEQDHTSIETPISGNHPRFEELKKESSVGVLTYVNDWFLCRLRRSRLDIKRYKSDPSLDGLRDQEPWLSRLIIDGWYDDTATGYLSTPNEIPRSQTIVTGRNIGRDGLSMSGNTAKSDSILPAIHRMTLRLHDNGPRYIEQTSTPREIKDSTRRSSAPTILPRTLF